MLGGAEVAQLLELFDRHRLAEEVALDVMDAHGAEEGGLGLGLDAFDDHREVDRAGYGDDAFDDLPLLAVIAFVGEEAVVELDAVDVEVLQRVEGRDARAEIIHEDVHAGGVAFGDERGNLAFVIDVGRFGDFDFDVFGRDAGFLDGVKDGFE